MEKKYFQIPGYQAHPDYTNISWGKLWKEIQTKFSDNQDHQQVLYVRVSNLDYTTMLHDEAAQRRISAVSSHDPDFKENVLSLRSNSYILKIFGSPKEKDGSFTVIAEENHEANEIRRKFE